MLLQSGFLPEPIAKLQILFVFQRSDKKKVRKSLALLNFFATHQRENAFFFEFVE